MSRKVQFKLNGEETQWVQVMANALGLSIDALARKSLFQVVNHLYELEASYQSEEQRDAGEQGDREVTTDGE